MEDTKLFCRSAIESNIDRYARNMAGCEETII